jgi:hypothetical protein
MIVKCDYCHEEYNTQPFFYGHSISTKYNPNRMENYYTVYVRGKSICPCCGHTVEVEYEKVIGYCDMERIATKERD